MSPSPARRLVLRGEVERRHEADDVTTLPGDAVVVVRGRERSIVIACPDGCGERLTINLDPAMGPAWRLYRTSGGVTLYPSVWRDSGCGSHFIVWRDSLLWCDRWEDGNVEPPTTDTSLPQRARALLQDDLRPYAEIAARLSEIPWEVLRACRALARAGQAREGVGPKLGWFCKA